MTQETFSFRGRSARTTANNQGETQGLLECSDALRNGRCRYVQMVRSKFKASALDDGLRRLALLGVQSIVVLRRIKRI